MKKYLSLLQDTALFKGLNYTEIETVLNFLNPNKKIYRKNQYIFHFGDCTQSLGLLLTGKACIIKEDFWGNRNILTYIMAGQIFAEAYACVPDMPMAVSVTAEEDSAVLFLDIRRLINAPAGSSSTHTHPQKLLYNFITLMAEKNLMLNQKITYISQRSTREKLLSYLSTESLRQNSPAFDIPFNRQQLADYLSVDRSAMSSELGKMRDEGLLTFRKNHFILEKL